MLMNSIKGSAARFHGLGGSVSYVGPTLARLTLGVVFLATGWGKLNSLPDVTAFFTELGIPYPGFNARLTAVTEFGGGVLMLLGLGARLVAIPLAFTMAVAIMTAKRAEIDGVTALFGFEEWSYLVMFVWIAVAGAGPISLDAWFGRWWARQPEVAAAPELLLKPK